MHKKMIMLAAILTGASLLYAQNADQLYSKNCKKCHGEDGTGHTMVGRMTKAADLTSDATSHKSDTELSAVIANGKGKMAGFREKLGGDAGVALVLSYVRSLKK